MTSALRLIAAAALIGGPLLSATAVGQTTITTDTRTEAERRHERADEMRERAKTRAQGALGRENVAPDDAAGQALDFAALSHQIARLGALLQRMGAAVPHGWPGAYGGSPPMAGPPIPAMGAAPMAAGAYGPEGPTARSVRALLEYRLVVGGNPRLAVGEVRETDGEVVAEIVTAKEGSLVEKYAIDKRSGDWRRLP